MKINKLQLVLLILISVLIGYAVGINKINFDWKNYKPQFSIINKEPPASLSTVDLSMFWNVWDRVNTLYYDKKAIDPQKMLNGAISGLVSALDDPYSMYLPPVQQSNFQQQMAGKFEGIGAELGMKDKEIIVIAPLDGSPAQKAGIRAGDIIAKVENTFTTGWTLQQAVDKIRGPKGTKVNIGVLHKDAKTLSTISITRDTITVKSVFGWLKSVKDVDAISTDFKNKYASDKVMYVRLSQFGDATNADWVAIVGNLASQLKSDKSVKGVILDLRNNPGGYLTDATFIAGEFLKEGTPVVSEDMGNGDSTTLSVNRQGNLIDVPMVVLINGGSASASEIVSGALQDYGKATLVGDQSFGKGTVQQALDMGQGAGLHVTIAKWLTPKGRWIHGKGLTPDVKVSLDDKDPSHDTQLEKAIQVLVEK
jgi:carboxyl-terminal processing protease